jgi:hypothetical protein
VQWVCGSTSRGLRLTHRRTAPNTVTRMADFSVFVNGYFEVCMVCVGKYLLSISCLGADSQIFRLSNYQIRAHAEPAMWRGVAALGEGFGGRAAGLACRGTLTGRLSPAVLRRAHASAAALGQTATHRMGAVTGALPSAAAAAGRQPHPPPRKPVQRRPGRTTSKPASTADLA